MCGYRMGLRPESVWCRARWIKRVDPLVAALRTADATAHCGRLPRINLSYLLLIPSEVF